MTTHPAEFVRRPYHGFEEYHLAPRGSGTPNPSPVELYDVAMLHSDHRGATMVGLDTTEFLLAPSPDASASLQAHMHGEIEVLGELEIKELGWLSEAGYKLLQRLVRERDNEGRLPGVPYSDRTLEQVYTNLKNSKSPKRPRVIISFHKKGNAFHPKPQADPLQRIRMKGRPDITYIVHSMNARCFDKSVNWYRRYQLFHCMKHLIENSEDTPPIEERTIDWFIAQYRIQIHPLDKTRRIIGDPDPSVPRPEEPLNRHLRHLSDGDIRGRFADQCEWLLANQIASTSQAIQLFDVKSWAGFCDWVHNERKQSGWTWGMGYKQRILWRPKDTPDDPYGFERFGGSKKEWYKKLDLAKKKKTSKAQALSSIPPPAPALPGPAGLASNKRKHIRLTHIPDHDFSDSSSEGMSEWSADEDLAKSLTLLYTRDPTLAPGRTIWECPRETCFYTLPVSELATIHRHTAPSCCANRHRDDLSCPHIRTETLKQEVMRHELDEHLRVKLILENGETRIIRKQEARASQPTRKSSRAAVKKKIKVEPS